MASGQQYASKYSAYYEDKVENGNIYTANAVYELKTDQNVKSVYRMKATGYFEKEYNHKIIYISLGIVIGVMLIVGILYQLTRKKKTVSNSSDTELYR